MVISKKYMKRGVEIYLSEGEDIEKLKKIVIEVFGKNCPHVNKIEFVVEKSEDKNVLIPFLPCEGCEKEEEHSDENYNILFVKPLAEKIGSDKIGALLWK